MGNVLTAGQGQAPARQAMIGAGVPAAPRGDTLHKVCGSGMRAVMMAANDLRCGDFAAWSPAAWRACPTRPTSPRRPHGHAPRPRQVLDSHGVRRPLGPVRRQAHGQLRRACARQYAFTREEQDEFAQESYYERPRSVPPRAGWFADEIVTVEVPGKKGVTVVDRDEEPFRADLAKMGSLRPAFDKEGTVTAANASKINDGAAALVLATATAAARSRRHGRLPESSPRQASPSSRSGSPPRRCSRCAALERADLAPAEIDLFEINEAFAVVALALRELEIPPRSSTSAAAPSPSVTRSAPPARASWSPCSTPSAVVASGIGCAASASVAARPRQPATTPATETETVTAPATEPTAETSTKAPIDLDRIAFEFRVPAERGGGGVAGTAGAIETQGELEAVLSGGVEIKYRDLQFSAERVVIHRDTMTLEAEGDVVFDQGSRRVAASRADFDLATETGTFWNASAFAEPDQYFHGDVVTKTGENSFEIQDGVLTSCTGDPTPDWSLRIASAKVELGGYAHLKHARMRMKKAPLFYWPYLIWPAKTERSSGFLIPNVGYSASRGVQLGLAYYQVMGPSADLTLLADAWEKTWAGAGAEFRYHPTEGTRGNIAAYLLADRDLDRQEWRTIWNHSTSDLPGGLRGVVSVNQYSDYDFFREFQRSEEENTRRFLYSNAFLSGNWGAQSLSMIVDQRETFLSDGRTSTQRQLPEVTYRVRKLKLGRTPLYFSLDSTASYLASETDQSFDVTYGRFDLAPQLTVPLRVAPWMSVAISGGGRTTWWGDSLPVSEFDATTGTTTRLCEDGALADGEFYCGESLSRNYGTAQVDVVGPTFSKIFDSPGGAFSKLKHVIEPRFNAGYVGDFEDQLRVSRFDEIDQFSPSRIGTVTLVNRVLAKPTDESKGGAFEVFSLSLAQSFSFDDEQPLQRSRDGLQESQESPIFATLRYSPSRVVDLQARATWSTLFADLQSTSLSLRAKGSRAGVDLTWYTNYDPELGGKGSDQTRFGFNLDIIKNRLTLAGQLNYDLLNSEILQQRYFLDYRSQCWSLLIEGREQVTGAYVARDYRFLLSLKNVGTFLDLNGGSSAARF
jgi:lipopolysaccharide assembly outer membrane protein LptD (OstA)/acetyl-CoA acetyltransferase